MSCMCVNTIAYTVGMHHVQTKQKTRFCSKISSGGNHILQANFQGIIPKKHADTRVNQEQDLESRQGWDLRNLNPTVCRGRGQIEIPSKSAFA